MSKKVVLAGACRTAIGTMGGSLSTTPAAELGAIVIKEALNRAGVKPEQVDQVYMGCVIQAGLGQNVARQASIKAGLPIEVPAVTMNVVCGSGLNCVNQAAQMIMAGDADIVVAGGMENMSMAPYAVPQARFGYRMNNGTLVDTNNRSRAVIDAGSVSCGYKAVRIDRAQLRKTLDRGTRTRSLVHLKLNHFLLFLYHNRHDLILECAGSLRRFRLLLAL